MARRSRQGVLKRQRERKKAEKAALKREQRVSRERPEPTTTTEGSQVASQDDLLAYGVVNEPDDEAAETP